MDVIKRVDSLTSYQVSSPHLNKNDKLVVRPMTYFTRTYLPFGNQRIDKDVVEGLVFLLSHPKNFDKHLIDHYCPGHNSCTFFCKDVPPFYSL